MLSLRSGPTMFPKRINKVMRAREKLMPTSCTRFTIC